MTTLGALHDRQRRLNSRTGSIYIVKPKMPWPAEIAFADDYSVRVEKDAQSPREYDQDGDHG